MKVFVACLAAGLSVATVGVSLSPATFAATSEAAKSSTTTGKPGSWRGPGKPSDVSLWIDMWPDLGSSLPDFTTAAASTEAPPGGPRDFSGTWQPRLLPFIVTPTEGADENELAPGITPGLAPYNEKGKRTLLYRLKMNFLGTPIARPGIRCRPGSMIWAQTFMPPVQFVHGKDRIVQLFVVDHSYRTIYLNRSHPKDLKPTYSGHSVGHWDGDTLIVDTIGFKSNWLEEGGSPTGERLHLVERIRKSPDNRSIENEMTIDDPEFYRRPFKIKATMSWSVPSRPIRPAYCEENQRVIVVKGVLQQGGEQ